ncbi:Hypothetical protein, putative [Bodo saltans]|uniref:TLDc domain-containing protein n=1 Tax=Bodo saltans TaxID=75058 RepID=A0A0S4JCM6_BODSA|nr:Hypothetical protein, putative [Bodo saltans]|eukprot:CUG87877.1 Hypothetical protein, putative [Bodo saltans]
MGQKHSTHVNEGAAPQESHVTVEPHPIQAAPLGTLDVETDGAALCDTSPKLFEEVQRVADSILRSQYWKLLFTTRGGRSFPRMVRQICNGGPSVVVLELLSSTHRRLIITTVNRASWKMAAERKGAKDFSEPASLKKTSTGFFGDSHCLLHVMDPVSGVSTEFAPKYSSSASSPALASANNFMYLIDDATFASPPSEVGIGMGGLPGRWSWFVGEDLEKCQIAPSSTFRPSNGTLEELLAISDWSVVQLDVFALEPDSHRPLEARRNLERRHLVKCFAMDAAGVSSTDGSKQSVLDSQGARTAMALLELGGAHTSYSEREDVCERNFK